MWRVWHSALRNDYRICYAEVRSLEIWPCRHLMKWKSGWTEWQDESWVEDTFQPKKKMLGEPKSWKWKLACQVISDHPKRVKKHPCEPSFQPTLQAIRERKMGLYAKRDVIRSLDFLLYCQFAYMYLLDASLLVLLFRILIQLVRFFVWMLREILFQCKWTLMHLFLNLHYQVFISKIDCSNIENCTWYCTRRIYSLFAVARNVGARAIWSFNWLRRSW